MLLVRRHQERTDRVDVGVRDSLTDGQCVYGHQPLVVQHRDSVDVLYWCKRNKRTLVVLVWVLEVMKERARGIGTVIFAVGPAVSLLGIRHQARADRVVPGVGGIWYAVGPAVSLVVRHQVRTDRVVPGVGGIWYVVGPAVSLLGIRHQSRADKVVPGVGGIW